MTTYFIAPSPTGNDTTGNGSNATPWATISKAHTSASSGDTIICKDGTYTWSNQTLSKNLTIQAENTGLAIFDGGAATIQWSVTATMSLIGLKFIDALGGWNGSNLGYPIFQLATSGITLTCTRCTFEDLQAYTGLAMMFGPYLETGFTTTLTLNSCVFRNLSLWANTSYLFYCRQGTNGVFNLNVINCIWYFDTTTPYPITTLFARQSGTMNIVFKNSIIVNDMGVTLTIGSGTGLNFTQTYTCFRSLTGTTSGTGNITSDPLFVDAASGVFDLRPTSPCLNTGTLV